MITNFAAKITAYEQGQLTDDEAVELFQELIDSGMAHQLQGFYGRMARHYIELGLCHPPAPSKGLLQ